jgi:hypothetical protein
MTTTPVLDAIRLSVHNQVDLMVDGREAMITTGCQTCDGVIVYVEFNDDRTSANFMVPATGTVNVVRILN